MPEYVWIYDDKPGSEYASVMNMSHARHSLRSIYKLMSAYWEMGVLRTVSKI